MKYSKNELSDISPQWMDSYNNLKRFYVRYKHACVPQNLTEYPNLGAWVLHQINSWKKLSTKQKNLLQKLNFIHRQNYYETIAKEYESIHPDHVINILEDSHYHKWLLKLYQLRSYYTTNYHSFPSYQNGKEERNLASWCTLQRKKRKEQKLHPIQIDELNKLNFNWNTNGDKHSQDQRAQFDSQWNKMFYLLKEFELEYGHTLVPQLLENQKYKGLGRWVNTQRTRKKKGILLPERYEKLNKIKFVWDKEKHDFKQKVSVLKKYYKTTGNWNAAKYSNAVPKEEKKLASMIQGLRMRGTTQERKEVLNKIGFDWSLKQDGPGRPSKQENVQFKKG